MQAFQAGDEWKQTIVAPEVVEPLLSLVYPDVLADDGWQDFVDRQVVSVCNGFSLPGQLFRILYIEHSQSQRSLLFVAAHHLLVDAYAFGLVTSDLFGLYEQYAANGHASLPSKTTSLAAFARASTQYWLSHRDRELRYWQSLPACSGRPPSVAHTGFYVPLSKPCPAPIDLKSLDSQHRLQHHQRWRRQRRHLRWSGGQQLRERRRRPERR